MKNKILNIKEASEYLNVSKDTLRNWDKSGVLKSHKTNGGHRRYFINELNDFIGKKEVSYGKLYEHLCSAQFIAGELKYYNLDSIIKIREDVGKILLNSYDI